MRKGQTIHAFDGSGGYYESEIIVQDKKSASILPHRFIDDNRESSLKLTLVQALAKGRKMDYIIQKSVEVGVHRIVPVVTEFSSVRIDPGRIKNRVEHWQKIIIGACEQCGRYTLPEISPPVELHAWLKRDENPTRLLLLPDSGQSIYTLKREGDDVTLICGPEGGLSDNEVESCINSGYQGLSLGPRILRTETAALAGLVTCQLNWGDMH
jgi:16S rRNA (uracil1498-N3)-methyltransferase